LRLRFGQTVKTSGYFTYYQNKLIAGAVNSEDGCWYYHSCINLKLFNNVLGLEGIPFEVSRVTVFGKSNLS
jgi:hypothetical protein